MYLSFLYVFYGLVALFQCWIIFNWKGSILILIPKKGSSTECANRWITALSSHASKVMIKISHARLQHYAKQELPNIQAVFRKGRGTRDQIANICWVVEKAREFQKTSTSVSSTVLKLLVVWIITNCGKLLKRWEYHTIYLSPEKAVCGSRSNS